MEFLNNQINPDNLQDPFVDGEQNSVYLGRGSFGIVKVQFYRGLKVAVKQFLARCFKEDIKREAALLSRFCHPYLLLLIGVCFTANPMKIVMQFHGVDHLEALTVAKELETHKYISAGSGWLILTAQLMEALRYLHQEVECLHNDIKCDNLLITVTQDTLPSSSKVDLPPFKYQLILIDFGKSTMIKEEYRLKLTEEAKMMYKSKHCHIASEVIDGITPYTTMSDIFAAGKVIQRINGERHFFNLPTDVQKMMTKTMDSCLSPVYKSRPTPKQVLQTIHSLLY